MPTPTSPPARIAARMSDIAPFHVMELLARAQALEAAGRDIVHMEVGEPDFPTPEPIVEAAARYVAAGRVPYTPALGIPALRAAIATFYRERYLVDVAPERIVITAGASGALLLALGVLTNPGDEFLLADPGYPCNRHFVRTFEGVPRPIRVDAACNFQPTAAHWEAAWTPRTRGLILSSPSNPTGSLIDRNDLIDLISAIEMRAGTLISDEIYHGLTYATSASSALEFTPDAFVVNSFSKYFGMTGWRLGWLVVPEAYLRAVEKLAQNLFICASAPAQYGALAAFAPSTLDMLEARRETLATQRDVLLPALRDLGFEVRAEPQGAFYIYADCSRLATDSATLCHDLLDQAGVAVTPGVDFGEFEPASHLRFSYVANVSRLQEGVRRMRQYFAARA
ncbi:MAG: pyridoxal phosphate-dependent aminotransferase [Rhodocyclaceae bacterium]|nr:pyridoxal phosphate-dependent aminotransferase [Rhodocyclaceae bacterium]MBX3667600.1 pyridoxal phosphate-dependent aminotransferase [Rhodocyclaceae bacterium]